MKLKLRRLITALVVVGICLPNIGANLIEMDKDKSNSLTTEKYTVKAGDTFWAITSRYRDKDARNMYLLEYQDEVRELNPYLVERHCQLQPNDVITIRYVEKK